MSNAEENAPQNTGTMQDDHDGEQGHPEPEPMIFAKRDETTWFRSLRNGWEGLLLADFNALQHPKNEEKYIGLSMKNWTCADVAALPQFTEDASQSSPLAYNLNDSLPPNGFLATVMETVTSLLRKHEGTPISRSLPQLICNSDGGNSWHYVMDKDPVLYRCFLFLGSETMSIEKPQERQDGIRGIGAPEINKHAFIATADAETLKSFGDTKVLTMTALYGEAHRKFRLELGDIVVLRGGAPFLIDFPTFEDMPLSRMLTWTLSRCTSEEEKREVDHIPASTPMSTIEDIVGTTPEAKVFYESEMSELEKQPKGLKDIGVSSLYMERLRVTPGIYDSEGMKEAISNSESFHNVSHWLSE